MSDRLPAVFDPASFADKRRHLVGDVPLDSLDRLADLLLDKTGDAHLDLQFGRSGRLAWISGRVRSDLVLQCQFCLGPVPWPVDSALHLGVVTSVDEALRLPDSIEALIVGAGEEVSLADIVQDELLLAIPTIPRHADCRASGSGIPAQTSRPNPFTELARLKKDLSSQE